jgi:hypothetical protein
VLKRITVLAIFSMVLAGCVRFPTPVYVLDKEELIRVQANQTVTAKFKGWLLSDRAVDRVMNAKIKATNLE